MKEIVNPHDKLFKEMESVKENARDLIESTFPKELLLGLDLDSLENDNNSYVDSNLKEYYSDLVFSCKYKSTQNIKITILFEHKSYKPDNEYLQLLQYILNIWNYAIKNNEKPPLVIPMIYYHGSKKWEVKPLSSYFPGVDETLKQFIPEFKYILTDLTKLSDKTIIDTFNSAINKVLALLLKHISDEQYLKDQFKYIFSLLIDYFGEEKRELVITFLLYILNTTDIERNYIDKELSNISPEGGQIIMTTAMKIRQEGKQEGRVEEKMETAKKMLINGADFDFVLKVTELAKEKIEQILEDIKK